VVGGGPIGRAIAGLLRAVGMRVDLVGRCGGPGVHPASALAGLLPRAEWLVLAAPLTEATRGLLGPAALAALPPAARVINVGRGELVVDDALADALRSGRLAGAALDVFVDEPLPAGSPLWGLPGLIVSPHMSGDVVGWQDRLVELFTDNLVRYRTGRPLRNVVDKARGYVPTPPDDPTDEHGGVRR
jgi:phosphoglycerate dehydrogenase-like enzyme